MGASAAWRDNVSSLDVSQQELLTGGGLSKRFTKLPLWLSHPSNIGAFYGLLVSMALILPYYMTEEFWFPLWLLHASLLVAAVAALGIVSRIINALTKRMPISVNRKLLYPMPFIGFASFHNDSYRSHSKERFHTVPFMGSSNDTGPVYIHLSWAPDGDYYA